MNKTDLHFEFEVNRPQINMLMQYSGNGEGGGSGVDGFSPTVSVSSILGGYHVAITDRYGTKSFDLMHGSDGAQGAQGIAGARGEKGEQGEKGERGERGLTGETGAAGAAGAAGRDGLDGVSPTVSVAAITGGNRVTITDLNGAHVFDVLNGVNGSGGGSTQVYVHPSTHPVSMITGLDDFANDIIVAHNINATAHDTRFATKVDKVNGKGLSTNDYTNADKQKLANVEENANNYTHPSTHPIEIIVGATTLINTKVSEHDANENAHAEQFATKVDKVNGKGLSTNDYTTAEKTKLAGVATNANNYTHPSTHASSMITGLANVAKSGNYEDLANKPSIPSTAGLATQTYVDGQIASLSFAPTTHNHTDVKIGTDVYTLRTGTEGAAGYITFVLE